MSTISFLFFYNSVETILGFNKDTFFNETKENNYILIDEDEFILKLICICTKDGKKNRSLKLIKITSLYILSLCFVNLRFLLKNAIYKIQNFVRIRLVKLRSRQQIFSNLLLTEQQNNISLRTINNYAIQNNNLYNHYFQSLSASIIYYNFLNNMSENQEDPLLMTMHENNELLSLNQHLFYRKIRYRNRKITGRRRFKLIKKYKRKEGYYSK